MANVIKRLFLTTTYISTGNKHTPNVKQNLQIRTVQPNPHPKQNDINIKYIQQIWELYANYI